MLVLGLGEIDIDGEPEYIYDEETLEVEFLE